MERRTGAKGVLGIVFLILLLPAVAAFWLFLNGTLQSAAVSDASRTLAAVMNQADRLADDLDLELSFLDAVFDGALSSGDGLGGTVSRVQAALDAYRSEARWPGAVKTIHVIDAQGGVVPDLSGLGSLSRVLRIERFPPTAEGSPASFRALVAALDEASLERDVFPDLATAYFGQDSGFGEYAVSVRDGNGLLRFSSAGPGDPPADFVRPLLRDVGRFDVARFYTAFSPRLVLRQESRPPEEGRTFREGTLPLIDRYRFQVGEYGGWTLEVSRRGMGIEPAERREASLWSLAALGFLLVLYGSVVALYLSARRTAELAARERAFVASVTHELKTPLAVTLSAGENLSKGIVPAERVSQYGTTVAREARRLSASVERILTLAGLESTQSLGRGEAVDLADAARATMARLAGFAESKGASFELAEEGKVTADGSRVLIESALESAMSNAVKYAGGAVRLSVSTRSVRGKKLAVFECADSGPGMSRKERARAFDPFWRGRASAGQDGTGVGLYLARRIALMHGGCAKLRFPTEGGTVLELTFRSFI